MINLSIVAPELVTRIQCLEKNFSKDTEMQQIIAFLKSEQEKFIAKGFEFELPAEEISNDVDKCKVTGELFRVYLEFNSGMDPNSLDHIPYYKGKNRENQS